MKLPSLDTAEGLVVLAGAAVIGYMVYKATKLPGAISDGLSAAASTVADIPHQINNAANSSSNPLQSVGDSIGSRTYEAVQWVKGLGGDSHQTNAPQTPSPDALGSINAQLGAMSAQSGLDQLDMDTSTIDYGTGDPNSLTD